MSQENGQTGGPLVVQNETDNAAALRIAQERDRLQGFLQRLNVLPPPDSIDKTPDGNALTVLISHIEMTLDEYFFGLWETYDFKWSVIANEVVGSIILEVTHPVSGRSLRRTGAAAIQIMVDKAPDEIAQDRLKKNQWANNPDNKKPAALDMGFPKLKAECTKNAAQSLGKLFGRDLNRKKADNYQRLQKSHAAMAATKTALNGNP